MSATLPEDDGVYETSVHSMDENDSVPLDFDIHTDLRESLYFFFLNPIDKWKFKKKFPYKLILQVLKIVFVTTQLTLFAGYRYSHVDYTRTVETTMRHLFIKDWEASREVVVYPPGNGPLAVYTQSDFFGQIDFTVNAYATIREKAVASFSYSNPDGSVAPVMFCKNYYKRGIIWAFNESYIFDGDILRKCIEIPFEEMNITTGFDSRAFLAQKNFSINFDVFVSGEIKFDLKTINFRKIMPLDIPDCYKLNVMILFDNEDHDGQIQVILSSVAEKLVCEGDTESIAHNTTALMVRTVLNSIVVLCCFCSFLLCGRALIRAHQLKERTARHFRRYLNTTLSFNDQLEFVNLWYLMILVNDVLIISGSIVKELVESKSIGDWWNVTGVLLGTGNLMVWVGVLRYLGFFKKYNILILTLKKSMPNILRFLFCVILIYAGFALCGWVVLGPYHIKFQTLSTTSECLFALVNGDDMFATFKSLATESPLLWWYTRIYLYSFITLFIYAILSLFTAIILDTYETIKQYYENGFPQTTLEKFIFVRKDQHIGMTVYQEPSCFPPCMNWVDRFMSSCFGWSSKRLFSPRPSDASSLLETVSGLRNDEREPLLPEKQGQASPTGYQTCDRLDAGTWH
ncbi:unnamed protein product [Notodromas monacha]|uniref:Mucolipin-3 n=1 Tax=Notodromas monacha TaxID=399045 RepID=A0A7R9BQ69_9CRUS|nr:unnamed protein product [Notodromas monacha]CAG0919636.1 unnamed protein product [Notodromas monacha]